MHAIGQVPAALNMAGPWQDSHSPESQGNAQPGRRATQSHHATSHVLLDQHLSERPRVGFSTLAQNRLLKASSCALFLPAKRLAPTDGVAARLRSPVIAANTGCAVIFRCTDQRRLPGAVLSAAGALLSTAALVEVSTLTATHCSAASPILQASNTAESTTTSVSALCQHQQWRTNAHAPMCDGFLHAGTTLRKRTGRDGMHCSMSCPRCLHTWAAGMLPVPRGAAGYTGRRWRGCDAAPSAGTALGCRRACATPAEHIMICTLLCSRASGSALLLCLCTHLSRKQACTSLM